MSKFNWVVNPLTENNSIIFPVISLAGKSGPCEVMIQR
ncbi:hypothetical protein Acj133p135 [Acinetobacter phage 133]|uniref:Uncharacterized protein n=1 Tax=Acinetobacter phage 133 TaxID=2919552 RepID=D9I669_9CAUD|nr:hypothetical protein Acj133p135 [Acinetobacter phage 133]ADJ19450.1 hypothetical protein Acj133p135 [Acinetobacter phage 133]